MKLSSSIVVALSAISLACPFAHATNWFVAPCGQDVWAGVAPACGAPLGPKRTIQAAIDQASDGDTIFVLPGNYTGTIDFDGKAIRVFGSGGAAVTTLNGMGGGPVVKCNSFEGSDSILEGLTITGGHTNASGGGMLNALSSPTIIECVFVNNAARVSGAGMANFVASPTIIDCQFIDNELDNVTATAIGGAIFQSGGTLDVSGTSFSGNTAVAQGGAIALTNNSNGIIDDCAFTANTAIPLISACGGALFLDGSTATVTGSSFEDNVVSDSGGAIGGVNDSELSLIACTIENNTTFWNWGDGQGGAVAMKSSTLSMLGCSVIGNHIDNVSVDEANGGAIHAIESTVSITFCGFSGNSAADGTGGKGGVIYAVDTDLTVTASTFTNNEATIDGGAIFSSGADGSLTLGGCTFTSNESHRHGGAVAIEFGVIDIYGCTFSNNHTEIGGGGGVYVLATTGMDGAVTDCSFTGNSSFNGGGMRISNGTLLLTESTFDDNAAINMGGGLSTSIGADLQLYDSEFTTNTSQSSGGGLAIAGDADVVGCEFSENSAVHGSGAYTFVGETTFVGCRFTENTATGFGAALGAAVGSRARVVNSLIIDNVSPIGSGTISDGSDGGEFAPSHMLDIVNCTIANNVGGGVSFENPTGQITMSNSIVWNNTFGSAIIGISADVQFSNIEDGYLGAGNIDVDPLFVNAVLGNYRLTEDSPCIDNGMNAAVPSDMTDLDIDGDLVELTPYDFDGSDRITARSGCGHKLVVDMGAFEIAGHTEPTPGDLNGDGYVNLDDLQILLFHFGQVGPIADVDGDNDADLDDLQMMLFYFGTVC